MRLCGRHSNHLATTLELIKVAVETEAVNKIAVADQM